MSWETEQWARQQRAGDPVRKAILVAVANEADTSGRNSFPSVKFIAYQCEVSERTVQRRLQELEDMCLLKRVKRFRPDGSQSSNGYDLIGYEPPSQFTQKEPKRRGDRLAPPPARLTGDGDASGTGGVTMVSPQGPTPLPIPPTAGERSPAVPPQGGLPLDLDEEKREEKREEPQAPRARRGTRLPEDWTPPPVTTLPPTVQAVVRQWPAGAYEFVAAGFAAHWTAESGARASKHDWKAAWVKWLTGENARVMATARNGIKFAAPATEIATPADCAAVERLQQSEDTRVASLRRMLREDLGERCYDGWLRPTAIGIDLNKDGYHVNVICPSDFMKDWVRQNFAPTIKAMASSVVASSEVALHFEIVSER